ncbi:dihydrolipoyl dehydrogenase [Thioclava nitratireducens]|uniref:Dihydrolipoyl dehydrogenase n=1 Tax=Thioclava nitratireducens TaxID=1915078 RepID=A0ABN4XDU6_9RHOB|nr:dihydrolipoyl dehydrogenase [Thioclava nitratireducens]AQS47671.1 dihydrolipoyl dehydrogenase [Thioclava nitratireducens]
MSQHARVVIIGSGSAGLSALREVRHATDDFLIINDGHWGTTCAESGCMPSKALIEAANAFHRRHDFEAFGISAAETLRIRVPDVMARMKRMRDDFTKSPRAVPEKLGEKAISGRARLLGPNRIEIEGHGEVTADAIILATGSSPVLPGPWKTFGDRIFTTDTLFDRDDLPKRIAVIGMGAIGVELAQAMARMGIEVAGFDALESVAGMTDPEVAALLRDAIAAELPLHLGAPAEISEGNAGSLIVKGAGGAEFEADAVLAAMGRRPNIAGLGLETLGVPLDDHGMPEVDASSTQIGDLPVFMAGDANAIHPILHEAADEGHIAGRNALAESPRRYRRRASMAIAFCAPNAVRVGQSFADLEGKDILIGHANFATQSRARLAEEAHGLIRIYAEPGSGKLLGCEMALPEGEHFAHLFGLAIQSEMSTYDMLAMPFYHPVMEEGLRSALREIARQLPDEERSDLADCPEKGHSTLD